MGYNNNDELITVLHGILYAEDGPQLRRRSEEVLAYEGIIRTEGRNRTLNEQSRKNAVDYRWPFRYFFLNASVAATPVTEQVLRRLGYLDDRNNQDVDEAIDMLVSRSMHKASDAGRAVLLADESDEKRQAAEWLLRDPRAKQSWKMAPVTKTLTKRMLERGILIKPFNEDDVMDAMQDLLMRVRKRGVVPFFRMPKNYQSRAAKFLKVLDDGLLDIECPMKKEAIRAKRLKAKMYPKMKVKMN